MFTRFGGQVDYAPSREVDVGAIRNRADIRDFGLLSLGLVGNEGQCDALR